MSHGKAIFISVATVLVVMYVVGHVSTIKTIILPSSVAS